MRGDYLLEVIGGVQDPLLPAAEQSVDELLCHTCLQVDDGQVQRPGRADSSVSNTP